MRFETVRPGVIRIRVGFLDVMMDVGLGFMMGTIFMNIAMQVYLTVIITAWDSTSQLIWKSLPWAAIGALIIALIRYVQNPSGY